MYISHVAIKNFRAVSDLNVHLTKYVNVVVGPNGVGKTTILQAIRVAKALAAPRTQQETIQVLISMGAASPHFPQRLFLKFLARNPSEPVSIQCEYTLRDEEINELSIGLTEIVRTHVASLVGQNFSNPAALLQFLQSDQGQAMITASTQQIGGILSKLKAQPTLMLGVTFNALTGAMSITDPLAAPLISFLDQRLPPSRSIFSYFPADRALPMGEVNLQVGGPDAQQQLEMHNSQPQIKYHRLKNLIVNSMFIETEKETSVKDEFEIIFSKLLKGRKINGIDINEVGLISIMTEEISTGNIIELDSLSSGEKNIALTFLIVAKSIADGGISLFDEPELHLNPAVSRDLLSFILENYSKKRNIQFIMCTHSPDILSGAFSSDECALLHLKSSTDISRVGRTALHEYSDALQRLGTSVSESLLYEGTILVEGDDDVTFFETAFPSIGRKFKIRDRGGRREVEKTIRKLQELESKNEQVAPIFVIFDRDEEITDLKSSSSVRLTQLKKRTIESYMLDSVVISTIVSDEKYCKNPILSEGEVRKKLRDLAIKQIDAVIAREIYNGYEYKNASITKTELQSEDIEGIAAALQLRMIAARNSLPDVSSDEWIQKFLTAARSKRIELEATWEARWNEMCDGKRLISDFHKSAEMKISEAAFRSLIIEKMRDTQSDQWILIKSTLEDLLQRPI